jgi:hypothetical protein
MSDDIQNPPLLRSLTESPRESANELGLENEAGPAFPPWIMVAGWIWIVLGSMIVIVVGLWADLIVLFPGDANALGQQYGVRFTGTLLGLGWVGVFSAILMVGGVQCFRAKARDVLPGGIVSIWMGLLLYIIAGFEIADGQIFQATIARIASIGIEGIAGVLLLVAGVMALLGRSQYKLWRKAQMDQPALDGGEEGQPAVPQLNQSLVVDASRCRGIQQATNGLITSATSPLPVSVQGQHLPPPNALR